MNKFTVGEVSFVPFPTSGRASLALFTSSFHHRFLFLKEVYLSRRFCCNPKVFDKISSMSKKLFCLDSEERKTEDRDFRFFENTRKRLLQEALYAPESV